MLFNCPLGANKAAQIIAALNLKPTDKVVDLGCGNGEFLSRIQQNSNADCLGACPREGIVTRESWFEADFSLI